MFRINRGNRGRVFPLIVTATASIGCAGLLACSGLLDVNLPGRAESAVLDNPALGGTLVLGAIADFECAYNNYVTNTALLTDEMGNAATGAAPIKWDARNITADDQDNALTLCGGWGNYTPLQTARFQAEGALKRLEGWSDAQVANRASLMARAAAYAGYAYVALGEGYCEMAVDGGPLLTPAQVLALAQERFTKAITLGQAAGDQTAVNLALVGRARTRLDLKRGNEAMADAQLVPSTFVHNVTREDSPDRRRNMLWVTNQLGGFLTADPTFRNLTWGGVPDPRVSLVNAGVIAPFGLPLEIWKASKVANSSSPFRLASWVEAQLIIAEVTNGQTAVGIINTLHQRAGIPGFTSSDPTAIAAQVREERRRELFLEGHRLNDLLRFSLPFPSGRNPADGNPYGNTTCLPLPNVERTGNPNIGD